MNKNVLVMLLFCQVQDFSNTVHLFWINKSILTVIYTENLTRKVKYKIIKKIHDLVLVETPIIGDTNELRRYVRKIVFAIRE